jgi:cell wall-associated NlpC family hydrolase
VLGSVVADHSVVVANVESLSAPVHVQALDIVSVDGQAVGPDNPGARDLVTEIAALAPGVRPDEIGTPWPIQSPGFFSDGSSVHCLHLAFEAPGTGSASASNPAAAYPAVTASASPGLPQAAEQVAGTGVPVDAAINPAAEAKLQAMVHMADSLLGKPYVWGGGHAGWGPQAGYDCSGFVSAVLHAGGFLSEPCDTADLVGQHGIVAGPGQLVTIYDRAVPDAGGPGHVIICINGQFWESGGEKGPWGGGGGVEKIGRPSAAYLATFHNVLHPEGL